MKTEREGLPADALRTTTLGEGESVGDRSFQGDHEPRFPAGTVLAERYRITALLGRGGMGEVYRADDLKLHQGVALKFLPEIRERRTSFRSRLLNEVRLARRVTHPNVCRIYDLGEVEGKPFISMELIEGEDLDKLLGRESRLPWEQAVALARQVCAGLAAAHAEGILHRDLKPANLMIDRTGRLRITDFGMADLAAGVGSGHAGGTPAFMAPEQLAGGRASTASDLFALGLVLYELLTGGRPWPDRREGAPMSLSDYVDGMDPDLERTILACLAEDPRQRPASALEVAAALPGSGAVGLKALCLVLEEGTAVAPLEAVSGDLLRQHGGREIPREDGAGRVLVFDRPFAAVRHALACHQAAREAPGATCKIGVHLAEVGQEGAEAEQVRLEPGALEIAGRLAALATSRQTLLSGPVFDLARQGGSGDATASSLGWLAHGAYEVERLPEPLEIYEVGRLGEAPLKAPRESSLARRLRMQDRLPGWRPAPGLTVPQRPRWVVEKKLGEGGFGEVWLGCHQETDEARVFKFCYEAVRLRALQREITLFRLIKEELGERDDISSLLGWNFDEAPYFIEGEYTAAGSLLDWSTGLRGIGRVPLEERLDLVAQIATALAAAHSVGVLHKDVKPGNVLIAADEAGRPRAQLADFGLGALTEHERLAAAGITDLGLSMATATSTTSGTRLYMAPEQVEGKAATLQADIYALGVLLFQMVVADFSRVLAPGWDREVEDELLRADIAAAVEGAPERRLANAAMLAERLRSLDERRRARRAAEHTRRTQRRRRLITRVMAVVTLIAAGFATLVTVQSRHIAREAETARQVSRFLIDIFKLSNPEKALSTEITAREILDRGAERIERDLVEQPEVQARMMHTIGVVYQSLGLVEEALPMLEGALDIRRRVHGDEHVDVAESRGALAFLLLESSDFIRAEAEVRAALSIERHLLGEEHPAVAQNLEILAQLLYIQEDFAAAVNLHRRALDMRRQFHGEESLEVAESLNHLGMAIFAQGDAETAESLLREALDLYQRLLGEDHPGKVPYLITLALILRSTGGEAEPLLREALAISRKLTDGDLPHIAASLTHLGHLARERGDYDAAEDFFRESTAMYRRLASEEHILVAQGLLHLANLLRLQDQLEESEKLYRETLALHRRILGADHPDVTKIQAALDRLTAARNAVP